MFTLLLAAAVLAPAAALGTAAVSAQEPARISRIEFRPATQAEGPGVIISLLGSGRCAYSIDYGDGTTEQRTAQLPDRVQHAYEGDGEYLVVATSEAPCDGIARATISLRSIARGIWSLSAEPGRTPGALEIMVTIQGRGTCTVFLDLGDGTTVRVRGMLPATRSHIYANSGIYELRATTASPCRGDARLKVDIAR
ncbi:MAG TPA: hypothetical protein VNJ03_09395 [Vicinamibacterales bacterium]|nr:hypothetical protein [Vicinamibacterales bacterium]